MGEHLPAVRCDARQAPRRGTSGRQPFTPSLPRATAGQVTAGSVECPRAPKATSASPPAPVPTASVQPVRTTASSATRNWTRATNVRVPRRPIHLGTLRWRAPDPGRRLGRFQRCNQTTGADRASVLRWRHTDRADSARVGAGRRRPPGTARRVEQRIGRQQLDLCEPPRTRRWELKIGHRRTRRRPGSPPASRAGRPANPADAPRLPAGQAYDPREAKRGWRDLASMRYQRRVARHRRRPVRRRVVTP